MRFHFTCRETAAFLAGSGPRPLFRYLQAKMHLLRCPQCRILQATLQALPPLAERALEAPDADSLAPARAALQGALAALGEGRSRREWPRTPVPAEAQALLEAGADLPLRLLASAHAALAMDRRRPAHPCHLPQAILPLLPPEGQWTWETGPGGMRRAELAADAGGGQRLLLVFAPPHLDLAPHRHLGSESLLVLEGSMLDGTVLLEPGCWVHHPRGTSHGPRFPGSGCWFLVREEGPVQLRGGMGPRHRVHAAS